MAEGMLRNTGVRAARESVDTGQGVKRVGDTGRAEHMGRGTFINWYDDLGISTTRPRADQMREQEKQWQSSYEERSGKVQEVRGKVDSAYGELEGKQKEVNKAMASIPSLDSAVNKAWGSFKSTLTPVRVVGKGDVVEGTYMVPREVADKFVGQRGIFASWEGEEKNILNVVAKNYRNKELHEPLLNAAQMTETAYKMKAQEDLAKQLGVAYKQVGQANEGLNASRAELAGYEGQVSSAEGMLKGAKDQHQKEWDDLHGKYNEKINRMQEIFQSLQVGKGKYEDSQA